MPEPARRSLTRPAPTPAAADVAAWQLSMRQAMFEALDADAVREIVSGLVGLAKKGDLGAARLVLSYAVGGPTIQVKNAIIQAPGPPAPLPTPPSAGLPRTELKMTDMARRVERGLPACDPRDRTHGED